MHLVFKRKQQIIELFVLRSAVTKNVRTAVKICISFLCNSVSAKKLS